MGPAPSTRILRFSVGSAPHDRAGGVDGEAQAAPTSATAAGLTRTKSLNARAGFSPIPALDLGGERIGDRPASDLVGTHPSPGDAPPAFPALLTGGTGHWGGIRRLVL